jgi:hypothetical protein
VSGAGELRVVEEHDCAREIRSVEIIVPSDDLAPVKSIIPLSKTTPVKSKLGQWFWRARPRRGTAACSRLGLRAAGASVLLWCVRADLGAEAGGVRGFGIDWVGRSAATWLSHAARP